MLMSLSYLSVEADQMNGAERRHLNEECSFANGQLGITGVLYCSDGLFFQTLEGEEEVVYNLMEKITVDRRHSQVNVVSSKPIETRIFPFWSMKFFAEQFCERNPNFQLGILSKRKKFVAGLHEAILAESKSTQPIQWRH